MSEVDFKSNINTLASTIQSVGASEDTMKEKGRCVLSYHLDSAEKSGFFKKGDIGIVILITDEDDNDDVCVAEIKRQVKDSTSTPKTETRLYYKTNEKSIYYSFDESCFEGTKTCRRVRRTEDTKCITAQDLIASNDWLKNANPSIDSCEDYIDTNISTTYAGMMTCADVYVKIPGAYNCTSEDTSVNYGNGDGYTTITSTKNLSDRAPASVPVAEKMNYVLLDQVKNIFGENNFYMAGIYNTGSCGIVGEQSIGSRYSKMLNYFKSNQVSVSAQSICSNDYSSTLNGVSKYAKTTVSKSYKISVNQAKEHVKDFKIKRGNQVIDLEEGKNYSISGSMVNFIDFELEPTDEFLIKYEENAPPEEEVSSSKTR